MWGCERQELHEDGVGGNVREVGGWKVLFLWRSNRSW